MTDVQKQREDSLRLGPGGTSLRAETGRDGEERNETSGRGMAVRPFVLFLGYPWSRRGWGVGVGSSLLCFVTSVSRSWVAHRAALDRSPEGWSRRRKPEGDDRRRRRDVSGRMVAPDRLFSFLLLSRGLAGVVGSFPPR